MPKYKIGDVAALFPNPPKPKTESGKKIQSLFNDFYNKSSKPSKKFTNHNQVERQEKPVEVQNESMVAKEPKKKKRKFRNSSVPDSTETTDVHITKKPKLEPAAPTAPFPRNKKSKGGGYLPQKVTEDYLGEEESFIPITKTHSQEGEGFPRKKAKQSTSEEEDRPVHKKKNKKKSAKGTSQEEDFEGLEESNVEGDFPESEAKPEKESRKKKKSKKNKKDAESTAQEEEIPDFLKLIPKDAQEGSKVVFRMKKKREIPSAKDVFENKSGNVSEGEKRKSKDRSAVVRERVEETEERLSRTLFVGNLPVNTTKKSLEKLFSPFGSLENCRLRGAVPTKSTIPRKVAEIKGKYHAGQNSRIAYVVLKDRASALSALSLSGVLIDGHHIVVDRAGASGEKKLYDEKRTIFVGNLPFAIKDETLWSSFLPCGDIEAVRVIRDKETGAGKGFGYVSFQKIQGKEKALALTNLEIEGRRPRIKCVEEGKKKKQSQAPPPWKGAMKRLAKKEKRDGNPNSRKTLRKLMNRGKLQHQKKRVASIFKKFSKN